jgi:hypothetical protein
MRPTVLAWWLWAGTIVIVIGGAFALSGCGATTGPYKAVCAVQPIGMTDSGVVAVRVYCESE